MKMETLLDTTGQHCVEEGSSFLEDSPPGTPRSPSGFDTFTGSGMLLNFLTPVKTGPRKGDTSHEDAAFLSPTSTLDGGTFSPDSVISETDWTVFDRPKPRVLDFGAVSSDLSKVTLTEEQDAKAEDICCAENPRGRQLRFPSFPNTDDSWITVFDKEARGDDPGFQSRDLTPASEPNAVETGVVSETSRNAKEDDHSPSAPNLPTPVARALFDPAPESLAEHSLKGLPVSSWEKSSFEVQKQPTRSSQFKATWARTNIPGAAVLRRTADGVTKLENRRERGIFEHSKIGLDTEEEWTAVKLEESLAPGSAVAPSVTSDRGQHAQVPLKKPVSPPATGSKLAARRGEHVARALNNLRIGGKPRPGEKASPRCSPRTHGDEARALFGAMLEPSPDSTPFSTSSESDWSPDQPGQTTPTPQHESGKRPPLPPYGPRLNRSARRSNLAAIAEQPPRVERKTKLGRAQNPARAAASDEEKDDSAWERAKALRVNITPRATIPKPSVSLDSEDYFEIQDPLSGGRTETGSGRGSRGSDEGSRGLDPRLSPRLARLLRRVPGIGALTTERMERLVESAHMLEYGSGEVIAKTGTNCCGTCVVLEGRVLAMDMTFTCPSANGILGPGDWFGLDCGAGIGAAHNLTWTVDYRMIETGAIFFARTEVLLDVFSASPPAPLSTRLLFAKGYRAIAFLGQGAFGRVHLVEDLLGGGTFALKKIPKSVIRSFSTAKTLAREVRALRALSASRFVGRVERTFADWRFLYILQEPLLGGELHAVICRGPGCLNEEDARFYLACAVLALCDVHSAGILHRDVKPENLLLDRNGYLKLVDFGYSTPITACLCDTTYVGTVDYMPPEVVRRDPRCWRPAADWWSLGVTLFCMLTGTLPFSYDWEHDLNRPEHNKIYRRITDDYFPKHHLCQRMSREAFDLLSRLMNKDPRRRAGGGIRGAAEIQEHPWFEGFNWWALKAGRMRAPYIPCVTNGHDASNFCPPPEQCAPEPEDTFPDDPALVEENQKLDRLFNET
ncbi:Serine Threonine protein kinase [Klebsormidium nitens]|uniref:cGMP-dependent protein kinase n=1 Tax=Klebsormidium nitens TaxID=105231 RepID=A0A1Y1HX43_KLENI|nr:Serine Threonine protein kinase [Klebsormidium nitens]|eukprot:GAQ81107.1 Serine Threonine protein kinase [Klebsormidium nitens]